MHVVPATGLLLFSLHTSLHPPTPLIRVSPVPECRSWGSHSNGVSPHILAPRPSFCSFCCRLSSSQLLLILPSPHLHSGHTGLLHLRQCLTQKPTFSLACLAQTHNSRQTKFQIPLYAIRCMLFRATSHKPRIKSPIPPKLTKC